MSGTSPTPAEQHLGDRLAALVDGELGHDARERVLAHLATCPKCKAEADAQRRLKSVFAQAAPPPPSAGLLARLQGLPGGAPGGDDDRGGPFGPGSGFGVRPGAFGYAGGPDSAFRIHEVGRQEAERSPWRGRRFAFAAASAVSFAAIALGGALPTAATVDARGDGTGNNVTPLRSPGQTPSGAGTGDSNRRRGGGSGPVKATDRSVPPLSAVPLHAVQRPGAHPFLSASPLNGVSALSGTHPAPLIRPAGLASHLATASGTAPAAAPSPSSLPLPGGR
ncbi:anti-sigma factor family protein [Streptomyces ficellus]|uniref:Zf-HC2 domain-containing protein n=1 Tax=Streptomyces ficellus TaxID=1977088 RepID=A0A6I6FM99_9ACTN|nr:zf-HC2 domain-containing protein [Streptomyces ficellus]QGV78728.1 zf-HC2 domain-containing protein [Streptomyces ficellus]